MKLVLVLFVNVKAYYFVPEAPKPVLPRSSPNSLTKSGRIIGWITNWAIRVPGSITK